MRSDRKFTVLAPLKVIAPVVVKVFPDPVDVKLTEVIPPFTIPVSISPAAVTLSALVPKVIV